MLRVYGDGDQTLVGRLITLEPIPWSGRTGWLVRTCMSVTNVQGNNAPGSHWLVALKKHGEGDAARYRNPMGEGLAGARVPAKLAPIPEGGEAADAILAELLAALDDPSATIRESAMKVLDAGTAPSSGSRERRSGATRTVAARLLALAEDPADQVRWLLAWMIPPDAGEAGEAVLIRFLFDDSRLVRQPAQSHLEGRGHAEIVAEMKKLVDHRLDEWTSAQIQADFDGKMRAKDISRHIQRMLGGGKPEDRARAVGCSVDRRTERAIDYEVASAGVSLEPALHQPQHEGQGARARAPARAAGTRLRRLPTVPGQRCGFGSAGRHRLGGRDLRAAEVVSSAAGLVLRELEALEVVLRRSGPGQLRGQARLPDPDRRLGPGADPVAAPGDSPARGRRGGGLRTAPRGLGADPPRPSRQLSMGPGALPVPRLARLRRVDGRRLLRTRGGNASGPAATVADAGARRAADARDRRRVRQREVVAAPGRRAVTARAGPVAGHLGRAADASLRERSRRASHTAHAAGARSRAPLSGAVGGTELGDAGRGPAAGGQRRGSRGAAVRGRQADVRARLPRCDDGAADRSVRGAPRALGRRIGGRVPAVRAGRVRDADRPRGARRDDAVGLRRPLRATPALGRAAGARDVPAAAVSPRPHSGRDRQAGGARGRRVRAGLGRTVDQRHRVGRRTAAPGVHAREALPPLRGRPARDPGGIRAARRHGRIDPLGADARVAGGLARRPGGGAPPELREAPRAGQREGRGRAPARSLVGPPRSGQAGAAEAGGRAAAHAFRGRRRRPARGRAREALPLLGRAPRMAADERGHLALATQRGTRPEAEPGLEAAEPSPARGRAAMAVGARRRATWGREAVDPRRGRAAAVDPRSGGGRGRGDLGAGHRVLVAEAGGGREPQPAAHDDGPVGGDGRGQPVAPHGSRP